MAKRVLIEQAQNGYVVRCGGQQSLSEAPLHLVATWSELLEILERYLNETPTGAFGERDSFPVQALPGGSMGPATALERHNRSIAPTVRAT